jgi:teichuronic acid biosynthesis glycosyltransferase TuaG
MTTHGSASGERADAETSMSSGGRTTSGALVSVIVPCYNAAPFVRATIASVLRQSWSDLEVLAVDDGSTDATFQIIEAIAAEDPRVRVIRLPRNHGSPAAPRNAGVAAACGTWVAFLDADDLWHPLKLELQLRALHEYRALMCSALMKDFVDERKIVVSPPYEPKVQRIDLGMQLRKYRTPTSSIVAHRDLMRRLPFNEHIAYRAREDTDCFIRAHEEVPYSIKILHPLVFYRQQTAQISGNKWKMIPRHLAMLKKYRLKSGRGLGAMAYVYTMTHFTASIYLRWFRGVL